MRTTPHKNTYEISDWVETYSKWNFLLKPEEIILDKLKDQLPAMRMLDIGVGGGRTTCYFAELTKEYVGIDFDDNMIQACTKRFPILTGKASFKNCDVRSMDIFKSEYFDFILFSFNGLDYLSHEDRRKALREIKRVGKIGGYFFFSTHNLNSIDQLFSLKYSTHPIILSKALLRYFGLKFRNKNIKVLKSQEHAMVYDGVYSDKLKSLLLSIYKHLGYFYYSKPEEQVRQLEDSGFKIIHIYARQGREIMNKAELSTITDYWLHYFCEMLD